MSYIKEEDIKEYVSKNPTGIAGMSKDLTDMVNYFVELIEKDLEKKYFSAGYIAGQSDGTSETIQLTELELDILKGEVK